MFQFTHEDTASRRSLERMLIGALLPMQPHFQSNKPSINLVKNQICHRIDAILLVSSKYGQLQLVMKNYLKALRKSEMAKYFEGIIICIDHALFHKGTKSLFYNTY